MSWRQVLINTLAAQHTTKRLICSRHTALGRHPSRLTHRMADTLDDSPEKDGPGELARRTPTLIDDRVRASVRRMPKPDDRRDDQHRHSGPIESPPDPNIWARN